jgi:transcriptional regulator with XRE-family HTH domain
MDQHDEFRSRLRTALSGRGMTQSELARRLSVRDATVSDWFNRGTMPGGTVMLRLPELLGVDGHWLLTGKHRRAPRGSRTSGDLAQDLPEDVRGQAVGHLEAALELLRGQAGDDGGTYLRVREASEDEQRALEAVDERRRRRPASPQPRRNRG